jgi:hypothetical protein
MRRFLTSTTTVLERPWLKLCLTLPVSTVRLRPSGGRVPSFGFSVWSVILFLRSIFFSRAGPQGGFSTFRTSNGASESSPPCKRVLDTRSGGGIGQGDMYHILAPKCHRQDSALFREYHPHLPAPADAPCLVERPAAVVGRIGGVNKEADLAGTGRSFDAIKAANEIACTGFHAETIERGLSQRTLGALTKIGRNLDVIGLERALQGSLQLALQICLIELVAGNADPGAAARSASADIGPDGSIRPERQADQLVPRALSARENARPFRDVLLALG